MTPLQKVVARRTSRRTSSKRVAALNDRAVHGLGTPIAVFMMAAAHSCLLYGNMVGAQIGGVCTTRTFRGHEKSRTGKASR